MEMSRELIDLPVFQRTSHRDIFAATPNNTLEQLVHSLPLPWNSIAMAQIPVSRHRLRRQILREIARWALSRSCPFQHRTKQKPIPHACSCCKWLCPVQVVCRVVGQSHIRFVCMWRCFDQTETEKTSKKMKPAWKGQSSPDPRWIVTNRRSLIAVHRKSCAALLSAIACCPLLSFWQCYNMIVVSNLVVFWPASIEFYLATA